MEEGLSYPALRTLRRSIQNTQFESGILEEIFYLMKTKVECMKETERICCLTFNKMKLQTKVEIDKKVDNHIGYITLPHHTGTLLNMLKFSCQVELHQDGKRQLHTILLVLGQSMALFSKTQYWI